MKKDQITNYLTEIGTSQYIAQILSSKGNFLNIKTHQKLIDVGDILKYYYIVLKGGFVLQYVMPYSGIEKTVNFHLKNHQPFITIWESFFTKKSSKFQLKSITNSDVLQLKLKDIERLYISDNEFKHFYEKNMKQDLLSEREMKTYLISYKVKELYNYLQSEKPNIIKNVPTKYIAEFLGVSREWLSKIKNKKE